MSESQTPAPGKADELIEEAPFTATAAANVPSAQAAGGPLVPAEVHVAAAPRRPAAGRGRRGDPAGDHRPVHELAAGLAHLLRDRRGRPDRPDRAERPDLAGTRRPDGRRRVHDGAVPADRARRGPAPAAADPAGVGADGDRRRCARGRGRGPAARALPRRRDARAGRRPARPRRLLPGHVRRRPGPAGPRAAAAGGVHELHRLRLRQLGDRHEVAGLPRHDLPAPHLLPAGEPDAQPDRAHLAGRPRPGGRRRARRHQPGRLAGAGVRGQRRRCRPGRRGAWHSSCGWPHRPASPSCCRWRC